MCVCLNQQLSEPTGQAGADAQASVAQQGVMLQRSKWTAQVGLVLHSQVPSPLAGYVLPPGMHSRHCEP